MQNFHTLKTNWKEFIYKSFNMVRGKEISLEDRVAITTLREAGYSFGEIANKVGCSKSAAYKVFKNFQQAGNLYSSQDDRMTRNTF